MTGSLTGLQHRLTFCHYDRINISYFGLGCYALFIYLFDCFCRNGFSSSFHETRLSLVSCYLDLLPLKISVLMLFIHQYTRPAIPHRDGF